MTDKTIPVRNMIKAWEMRDLDFLMAQFADDAIFDNVPMNLITGKAAIQAAIGAHITTIDGAPWELVSIAQAADGTVLTERVDVFLEKDGRRLACPVMGSFKVNDDNLITQWRDYFDLSDWNRQAGNDPDRGRRAF